MAILSFLLLGLAVMDAETMRLPDAFTLPGIVLGILYSGVALAFFNLSLVLSHFQRASEFSYSGHSPRALPLSLLGTHFGDLGRARRPAPAPDPLALFPGPSPAGPRHGRRQTPRHDCRLARPRTHHPHPAPRMPRRRNLRRAFRCSLARQSRPPHHAPALWILPLRRRNLHHLRRRAHHPLVPSLLPVKRHQLSEVVIPSGARSAERRDLLLNLRGPDDAPALPKPNPRPPLPLTPSPQNHLIPILQKLPRLSIRQHQRLRPALRPLQ